MKGKHRRRRRQRDKLVDAAEVERLAVEVALETQRAERAHDDAAQVRTAQARLVREQLATQHRLRGLEQVAGQVVKRAAAASVAIAQARSELRAAHRALSAQTTAVAFREGMQAGLRIQLRGVHPSATRTLYRAKLQAHIGTEATEREVSMAGWVPDHVRPERESLAPYARSTVLETSPEACWTWAVPPWLALPDDAAGRTSVLDQLGMTGHGQPVLTADPYPRGLRVGATITSPWRHSPLIGQPCDAIDLAYWYHRSAFAQQWRADQQPVPFWLPAEHATSYPDAQPLPAGTDLRLPHPFMFVGFAAPWRLQPTGDPALADWQLLLMHARGQAAYARPEPLWRVLARLQSTGITRRNELPDPFEILDAYGGGIEGLLLAANPDGTPADEFAWCLIINHPWGFPLARLAVPSSLARTRWSQQISNTIAGVALSQWHDHRIQPSQSSSEPAQNDPDVDGVRVLDINATSPRYVGDATETARFARPHLRRGHWRHQRVGPNRRGHRWIWVRATTVNGATVPANQVYTLQ